MASDNVKLAREIIKKYPEVFEALEEYDKTRKIPRLYHRIRINLTIDENILRDFKRYSEENHINISRFVEKKMLEKMKG